MSGRNLTERFLYGLRVEVRTTRELHMVMRYLDHTMPHWYGERWDYSKARPHSDLCSVGLASPESQAKHIVDGCVTVCLMVPNQNTISFAEFAAASSGEE